MRAMPPGSHIYISPTIIPLETPSKNPRSTSGFQGFRKPPTKILTTCTKGL